MKKHLQKAELNDRPVMMEYCHDLSVNGARAGDVRHSDDRLQEVFRPRYSPLGNAPIGIPWL